MKSKIDKLNSYNDINNHFHIYKSYSCPICDRGTISLMPLMETFACNNCNHMFTIYFDEQTIASLDTRVPSTWKWDDNNWQVIQEKAGLNLKYLLSVILLSMIPTLGIGIMSYLLAKMFDLWNFGVFIFCLFLIFMIILFKLTGLESEDK